MFGRHGHVHGGVVTFLCSNFMFFFFVFVFNVQWRENIFFVHFVSCFKLGQPERFVAKASSM